MGMHDNDHLARVQERAARTASRYRTDWVWPRWLELQTDPACASFVPPSPLPLLTNMTGRNWTMVGNVGSPARAVVDPAGLVTPWPDGWSVDWWIGAEDRWHFPGREVAVRQRLVGGAPVVETALRVPSGDAVQRVYAISGAAIGDEASGELVVVEFENRSPIPFVLAIALRPYNPEGLTVVERLELQDGRMVTVEGRPALLLPRPPSATAGATLADGDVAALVASLATVTATHRATVECPAGMAQIAVVYPLPHRALLRVALPLEPPGSRARRGAVGRRPARRPERSPALPSAEAVARGWASMARRGMRLELPPGRLADAIEANRKFLLLFHTGRDVIPGPFTDTRFTFGHACRLLGALDQFGFHDEVAEVLRTYPSRQKRGGSFFSERDRGDVNAYAICAMAHHWRLTRDVALLDELLPSIALGARWMQHRRDRPEDPLLNGFWSIAGLRDAAELLAAGGNRRGAASCAARAESLEADAKLSLSKLVTRRAPTVASTIASLVACEPLHLLAPDDPIVVALAGAVRERVCRGPAVYDAVGRTGLSPALTLQLAAIEVGQGDRTALARLQWLVDSATDTFTWPGAIHPNTTAGCMGDGHDGLAAAEFLNFVRGMLVRERDLGLSRAAHEHPTALELGAMLPDGWQGQPIEVHDAPTSAGRVSFVLRWHGDRPALLWELVPHDGLGSVRLTAPGLDRTWSSNERRGETLLAAATADMAAEGAGTKPAG